MSTAHSAGTSAQAFALLASRTRPPGCSGSSSGHVFLAGGGSGYFRGLEKPGRARPHVVCWRAQGECRFVQSRAVVSACSLLSNSLQPPGLLCQWDYPGKNTGVGWHFLLQGIVLIQGLNLYLLHLQVGSLPVEPLGKEAGGGSVTGINHTTPGGRGGPGLHPSSNSYKLCGFRQMTQPLCFHGFICKLNT